jgi:SAM-dependent methyltransferase
MRQEPCIVSGTKNYVPYSKGLIKNVDSGLVVAEKIPSEKKLQKLYKEEYFFGMEYSDYLADRSALEKNFFGRINRLRKLGHLKTNSHVVEVGCAYGYFLNAIKDEVKSHVGFDVTVEGVTFAMNELGVNAKNDNFLDAKFQNKIDLVCMWDLIEHVSHPEAFIEKSSKILRKGGALALTTGDIGTPIPRIRKGKWRMIHPPTHLYYFDKESMSQLLNKYGFDVVSYRYSPTYRNVGSVLNQLIVNSKAAGKNTWALNTVLSASGKLGLTKLNIAINTFDIMDVIAIKK